MGLLKCSSLRDGPVKIGVTLISTYYVILLSAKSDQIQSRKKIFSEKKKNEGRVTTKVQVY